MSQLVPVISLCTETCIFSQRISTSVALPTCSSWSTQQDRKITTACVLSPTTKLIYSWCVIRWWCHPPSQTSRKLGFPNWRSMQRMYLTCWWVVRIFFFKKHWISDKQRRLLPVCLYYIRRERGLNSFLPYSILHIEVKKLGS